MVWGNRTDDSGFWYEGEARDSFGTNSPCLIVIND